MTRRPPGPHGIELVRWLVLLRRDRLAFVDTCVRKYGDVVEFRLGSRRVYIVADADAAAYILRDNAANYRKGLGLTDTRLLLGDGLLTSDGDEWRMQRDAIGSGFRPRQLDRLSEITVRRTMSRVAAWQAGLHVVDLSSEMVRLTIEVTGEVLFGADLTCESGTICRCFDDISRWVNARISAPVPISLYVPTGTNRAALRARRYLRARAKAIGEACVRSTTEPPLRAMVIRAPKERVDGQIISMLLAGHETTAVTLIWLLYVLASQPAMRQSLEAEIEGKLAGRHVTITDLKQLPFASSLLDEVLRMYPPVWLIPRRSIERDEVGGYSIPADSEVLVCPYAIHRNGRYWDNPQRFMPERFLCDQDAKVPPFAYLPFGLGARACIGRHFGRTEALLAAVTIAQHARIQLPDRFVARPEGSLTLIPANGLPARIMLNEGRRPVAL